MRVIEKASASSEGKLADGKEGSEHIKAELAKSAWRSAREGIIEKCESIRKIGGKTSMFGKIKNGIVRTREMAQQ